MPTGLETFNEIRSEDSPESYTYRFDAPGGVTLSRQAQSGAVEVRQGDRVLAQISAPTATEADGTTIDVTEELDGATLKLSIAHRGADVAYPIQLDPFIDDEFTWVDGSAQQYWDGATSWHWATASTGFTGYLGDLFGWRGMHVYSAYSGSRYFSAFEGTNSYWYYQHPGPTARIQLASFGNWYNLTDYNVAPGACVWSGLWDTAAGHMDNWYLYVACPGVGPWGSVHTATSPNGGNILMTGLTFQSAGYRGAFWSVVGSVGVHLDDSVAPTVSASVPAIATDPNAAFVFNSADTGLGLRRIRVDSPTDPAWDYASDETFKNPAGVECLGTPRATCPPTRQSTSRLGNLGPGSHTIRIQVWDKVNNYYTRSYTVGNYPTSMQYGGPDGVNNASEYVALQDALDGSSDAARAALYAGLDPRDAARFDDWQAATVETDAAGMPDAGIIDEADFTTNGPSDVPSTPTAEAASTGSSQPCGPGTRTVNNMVWSIQVSAPGVNNATRYVATWGWRMTRAVQDAAARAGVNVTFSNRTWVNGVELEGANTKLAVSPYYLYHSRVTSSTKGTYTPLTPGDHIHILNQLSGTNANGSVTVAGHLDYRCTVRGTGGG